MIHELEELFKRQVRAWPQLAKGLEGLARAKTRPVRIDWFDIYIRHIPHRVGSTTASVDRESVAKRPCFLCAGILPPEEEGVQFDEDFTIYCNPFPIVDHHLTIAHKNHGLQRIASAPDHMHFQAASRGLLPIEKDTAGLNGVTVPNYGRKVFLFRGQDRSALIDRMDRAIDLLAKTTGKRTEPLINIAAFHERGEWFTYLFPRGKHRPEVFHTGELTVSPASIDLCGIFVVPLAHDFERITGDAIAAIFREVTLPDGQFREVAEKLESER